MLYHQRGSPLNYGLLKSLVLDGLVLLLPSAQSSQPGEPSVAPSSAELPNVIDILTDNIDKPKKELHWKVQANVLMRRDRHSGTARRKDGLLLRNLH